MVTGIIKNASQRKFKYLSTISGFDDTAFRQNKGYWIYVNQSGNLTLPEVGGSLSGETYAWGKLRFMNASGSEMNITDAGSSPYNWFSFGVFYYHDTEFDAFKYVCAGTGPGYDQNCNTISLNSWQGYFIYSNYDNITLIRQN